MTPLTAVKRRPTYTGTPRWLRQEPDSYRIYSGKESKNTYSSAKNTTVRRNHGTVETSPAKPQNSGNPLHYFQALGRYYACALHQWKRLSRSKSIKTQKCSQHHEVYPHGALQR
jgi:hypothetical protein